MSVSVSLKSINKNKRFGWHLQGEVRAQRSLHRGGALSPGAFSKVRHQPKFKTTRITGSMGMHETQQSRRACGRSLVRCIRGRDGAKGTVQMPSTCWAGPTVQADPAETAKPRAAGATQPPGSSIPAVFFLLSSPFADSPRGVRFLLLF